MIICLAKSRFFHIAAGVTFGDEFVMEEVCCKDQLPSNSKDFEYSGLSELSKTKYPPGLILFIDLLIDSTRCLPSTRNKSIEESESFSSGARYESGRGILVMSL